MTDGDGVSDVVAVVDGVQDAVVDGTAASTLPLAAGDPDIDAEALGEALKLEVAHGDGHGDTEPLPVDDSVPDADAVGEPLLLSDSAGDDDGEPDTLVDGVHDAVRDPLPDSDAVTLGDAISEAEEDVVLDDVTVIVTVTVTDADSDTDSDVD